MAGKLTSTAIKNAKAETKPYKLADGGGMYLLVNQSGKYWRLDYRYAGKRKTLALGVYPEVSLKEARQHRDEAKQQLANGLDPQAEKQIRKHEKTLAAGNTFEAIGREWVANRAKKWATSTKEKTEARLGKDVYPYIGKRQVKDITAPELLSVIRRVEARGANEMAHRTNQYCGQIFRYAIATGRAERDPSQDLRGALEPVVTTHHSTITDPTEIGALLRAIEGYTGNFITQCALRLAPLVFVRPGELRQAEWSEFDLDNAEWRIPAEKMKMKSPHIVPLSKQAITIIELLQPLTGNDKYLFPSVRSLKRPMSENTITGALRRLGYSGKEMTGHGFRSMASTLLNEQGWHHDAIERQLAHAERNSIRAAYNYAEYLPERKKMMQAWADYLGGLKEGGKVIPIHRKV